MADPSGPTVAEGPEEQETTSTTASGEGPVASTDAPEPGAADGPARPPEGTIADDAAADPERTTSARADRWPAAAAAPDVEGGEPAARPAGEGPLRDAGDADLAAGEASAAHSLSADQAADPDAHDNGDTDDTDDDDDAEGRRAKAGLLDKKVQLDAKVILAVVGFLAIAVGAYVLGQRQAKDDRDAAGPPSTSTTIFRQPTEYVPFVDEETGVKLSIPKEWTRRSTKNLGAEARLLAEVPNTQDTLLVRVNSYSKEVTKENLGDQKAVIDSLFAEEKQLTILGVEAGDLKGMPVLVYVYRFPDQSGAMGIHAHYFVFQGRKAVQMVFQALPENHYTTGGLGVVWGKISESLEVTPGPPPPFLEQLGGSATTAPGPTTAPPPSAPPSTG